MPRKATEFDVQDHLKTVGQQIAYLDDDAPSSGATAIGDNAKAGGVLIESRLTIDAVSSRVRR